jgi:hypothetical protein
MAGQASAQYRVTDRNPQTCNVEPHAYFAEVLLTKIANAYPNRQIDDLPAHS